MPGWYWELHNLQAVADRLRCSVLDLLEPRRARLVRLMVAVADAERRGGAHRERYDRGG